MPDQKMHETLIKKADQLLKIKQVRDIYENVLPYNEQFRPDRDEPFLKSTHHPG